MLESIDERESIICSLEWIAKTECASHSKFTILVSRVCIQMRLICYKGGMRKKLL